MSPHARNLCHRYPPREARLRAARIRYGGRKGVEAFKRWLLADTILRWRIGRAA